MDPNNNQAIQNPIQQPVSSQPAAIPPVQPAAPVVPQNPEGKPKKGMGKEIILIIILLLLVFGMAAYILFVKIQMKNTQKTTTDNNSSVLPSPTVIPPTIAPEDDLEIGSPEDDLLELDANVKAL